MDLGFSLSFTKLCVVHLRACDLSVHTAPHFAVRHMHVAGDRKTKVTRFTKQAQAVLLLRVHVMPGIAPYVYTSISPCECLGHEQVFVEQVSSGESNLRARRHR